MKYIQVIDGARNSTFEVYEVPDDVFDKVFANGTDIAFIDEVEAKINQRGSNTFWDRLYKTKANKKNISGIHGTLHLTGSNCSKQYYRTRRESDVVRTTAK